MCIFSFQEAEQNLLFHCLSLMPDIDMPFSMVKKEREKTMI